jgi:hypothetical protein
VAILELLGAGRVFHNYTNLILTVDEAIEKIKFRDWKKLSAFINLIKLLKNLLKTKYIIY